jgi:hypothetical protein
MSATELAASPQGSSLAARDSRAPSLEADAATGTGISRDGHATLAQRGEVAQEGTPTHIELGSQVRQVVVSQPRSRSVSSINRSARGIW